MAELTLTTFLTLDGVMQAPQTGSLPSSLVSTRQSNTRMHHAKRVEHEHE